MSSPSPQTPLGLRNKPLSLSARKLGLVTSSPLQTPPMTKAQNSDPAKSMIPEASADVIKASLSAIQSTVVHMSTIIDPETARDLACKVVKAAGSKKTTTSATADISRPVPHTPNASKRKASPEPSSAQKLAKRLNDMISEKVAKRQEKEAKAGSGGQGGGRSQGRITRSSAPKDFLEIDSD